MATLPPPPRGFSPQMMRMRRTESIAGKEREREGGLAARNEREKERAREKEGHLKPRRAAREKEICIRRELARAETRSSRLAAAAAAALLLVRARG